MDKVRLYMLRVTAELTRKEILKNVTQQFTQEAAYNFTQYVNSVHAASIAIQGRENEIKKALIDHLNETSTAVETYLTETLGRKALITDTGRIVDKSILDNLAPLR